MSSDAEAGNSLQDGVESYLERGGKRERQADKQRQTQRYEETERERLEGCFYCSKTYKIEEWKYYTAE